MNSPQIYPFYERHAPTMRDFFNFTEREPYAVLRSLQKTLQYAGAGTIKSKSRSHATVERFGMGWGGDPKRSSVKRKNLLVIHWPTVLKDIPRFVSGHAPAVAALAWSFIDLVRAKSPLLYDLLLRQLMNEFILVYPPEGVTVPLSKEELRIKAALTKKYLMHPKMWEAYREATHLTWKDVVDEKETVRTWACNGTKFTKDLGAPPRNQVSVLDLTYLTQPAVRRSIKGFEFPLLDGTCFPRTSRPLLQELIIASQCDSPSCGAFSSKGCHIVDSKLFTQYRSQLTSAYTVIGYGGLKEAFYDNHMDLSFNGGPLAFRQEVAEKWPGHNPDNIIYIDAVKLNTYGSLLYRLELARGERANMPKPPKEYVPKVIEIESPPINLYDGKIFTIKMLRRGSIIYMCPPWPMNLIASDYLKATKTELRKQFKGTIYVKASQELFYTFNKLMMCDGGTATKSRELIDWLHDVAGMDPVEYKRRSKLYYHKVNIIDKYKRNPNYTDSEIEAIRTRMRPGMSDDQREELIALCGGRKWKHLVLKASEIRKEMLVEGCTDINELPHLNYNAKLRRELENDSN